MVAATQKNLWVAASDGDLERVKQLISTGASPNDKDANSYTPMHAAASYAHLPLLEYLLSVGGDVNLPDDDGDTPLFTCESLEAARWLVEHGADTAHRNEEGMSAAEALAEDHPEVSSYLRSLAGGDGDAPAQSSVSELAIDQYASRQTADLLAQAQRIMEEAERDGVSPDERLHALVASVVNDGIAFGEGLQEQEQPEADDTPKRSRAD